MSYTKSLLEFSKKELEKINLQDTEIGNNILDLLQNLSELCGSNKQLMQDIAGAIPQLIELKPIAPITEEDFIQQEETNEIGSEMIERCPRYRHVYRGKDGKYYDDRYYTFRFKNSPKSDKMYIYHGSRSSKQQITLPYLPQERTIYLEDDSQGNFFHNFVSSSQ
jgi:hypothetical protein